jgi:hypothetical protein
VEEAGLGYKIILFTKMPLQIKHPETFLEVLSKCGYTWIWEDMHLMGDDGWLEVAIWGNWWRSQICRTCKSCTPM